MRSKQADEGKNNEIRHEKNAGYFYAAVIVLSTVLAVGMCAEAQTGLPTLIDREVFFGNPDIATPAVSPDGKLIAFRRPYKDMMNIWVERADEPFEKGKLLTAETKPSRKQP